MANGIKGLAVNLSLKIMSLLPIKNTIIFESSPDFACNTYPVYREFADNPEKYGKYRLMWLVSRGENPPAGVGKDDLIYLETSAPREMLRHIYYRATARAIVMSNHVKSRARKNQLAVFLCHGSKTKKTKNLYEVGDKIDYVFCQSHFFDDVICYEYDINKSQLVYLGYPRCDYLYRDCDFVKEKLGFSGNEKLIVWLPTYRKHKNGSQKLQGTSGIPLLRDEESIEKLSRKLCECGVHILLKPHPAEDTSAFESRKFPGFTIITDSALSEKGIQLYEILSASSAMISDYSSVFYDYLLCDRPIGLTNDDEESYKDKRGFALDMDALYDKAALRLPDISSLCDFVDDVSKGKDTMKVSRREIRDKTNIHNDAGSAKRAAEFISNELNKKRR